MGFWDDHKGSRWTADRIGDELVGTITRLRTETVSRQGKPDEKIPVVTVREHPSGRIVDLFAGATDLKSKLAELEPGVDWKLRVKYVDTKQTGQPKPLKLFQVEVWSPKPAIPDLGAANSTAEDAPELPGPASEAPESGSVAADADPPEETTPNPDDPAEDPF